MSAAGTTSPSLGPGPPPDRYGRPSRARRLTVVAASGVVGLLALGWLAWVVLAEGSPVVQSRLLGYAVRDDRAVSADVTVEIDEPGVEATCRLRASAEDHSAVGERTFAVTSADQGRRRITFRTEREATSVELLGCTAAGQDRAR